MKKADFIIWLLTLLMPITAGAATLSIEPFTIGAGEEKEMVIDLSNSDMQVTALMFDLRLPTGLSLKQANGEYDFDIAGRTTWKKHSLDCNPIDGIIRFLMSSSSNNVLEGTSGAIIKMTLQASSSFAGGTIRLENIEIVDPNENASRPSDVTYTIPAPTPTPKLVLSASPSGGQVSAGTIVTLTTKANGSTVSGCDIYYTTNDTAPSKSNGQKYFSGITISSACTLKAIAYKSGYTDSDVLTATYTIKEDPKPKLVLSASPSGGQVSAGTTVTLTAKADGSTVSGCDIYYTLNGNTPSKSNGTKYSSGITINSACTLRAIAYRSGYEDSDVFTATYTIKEDTKPELVLSASPSGGQVSAGTKVALTTKANGSSVSGCDIYYTLNGNTPSKSNGTKYSSGITINEDCTLNAIAYKDGYKTSEVLTTKYTIEHIEAEHIILPPSKIIKTNESFNCSITFYPSNSSSTVTWWSDDSRVATVDSEGNVTGISLGSTYINARIKNGYSDRCRVTVESDVSKIPSGIGVAAVAASTRSTHILLNDGSLWACGANDFGQLGDGTTIDRASPVKIMEDVSFVSAGGLEGFGNNKRRGYTFIIKNDGSLWACGYNNLGQLGDGTTTNRSYPVKIMEDVASVATGEDHTLIRKTDGSLWACGSNTFGCLGDGTVEKKLIPIKVADDVACMSAGYLHSMIVKNDGTLWTCGWNCRGQLGDGTTNDYSTPKQIMSGVATVSAGNFYSLIVKTDGSLWACGENDGQLGDGTTYDRHTPVKIMDDVISASAGKGYNPHSLMVKNDGSLWGCADNWSYVLGRLSVLKTTPIKIMDNVVSATAAGNYSLVIKDDESLWACGDNNFGQLGDGTSTDRERLTKIVDGITLKKLTIEINIPFGQVEKGTTVSLIAKADGSTVSGCDIYYTTNGSIPSKTNGTKYSSGITINSDCMLKVIAYKDGYEESDVLTATYTVKKKLVLVASPNGGQVDKGSMVTLSARYEGSSISGCEIFYTLNGSKPTKSSTKYTSSGIVINEDCTLKAIAYKDGYEDSDVLTAEYNVIYIPITIALKTSSAGYATFFDTASAYTLPNGLSAQVVTGASNSKLTFKTIADGSVSGVIPRGTAVMLVSDTHQAGTYTLTSSESTTTYTGTNLLHGSDEKTMTTGDGMYYKLSYGPSGTQWSDVFGWYWGAQNGAPFQIEGHKSWLVVPNTNRSRAAGFTIDGDATELEIIEQEAFTMNHYYDLQGRRVNHQPTRKGVYIKNGKKMIVK